MNRDLRPLTLITQVGLTVAVTLVISLLAGLWLDNQFGTKPLLTLVLALFGIIASTISVYRTMSASIAHSVEEIDQARREGRLKKSDDEQDGDTFEDDERDGESGDDYYDEPDSINPRKKQVRQPHDQHDPKEGK